MYEQEMNQLSEKMDKSITALKNEFTTIRTGQANASDYFCGLYVSDKKRRKELVKIVNKKSEEAKVAIRNIRRDGNDFLKKEEKNSDVSKDVIKGMEEKVQKLTDNKIKELETVTEKKIKEIMSV